MKRAERQHLGAIIEEVSAWVHTGQEIRWLAGHLPLSASVGFASGDHDLLVKVDQAAASGDLDEAVRLTQPTWFEGRKKLQPAYEAAARLGLFRDWYHSIGGPQRLESLHQEVATRMVTERDELYNVTSAMHAAGRSASKMLRAASHLPITREGALGDAERADGEALLQLLDEQHDEAMKLLDKSTCTETPCSKAHAAAKLLAQAHARGQQVGMFERLTIAANRVTAQLSWERFRMTKILDDLTVWYAAATQTEFDTEHLPLTRADVLSDSEAAALHSLKQVSSADLEYARVSDTTLLCEAGQCISFHESTARLAAVHSRLDEREGGQLLLAAAERLSSMRVSERQQLRVAIENVGHWQEAATRVLEDAEHLPLTRTGAVSDAEKNAATTIRQIFDEYSAHATELLHPIRCQSDRCGDAHEAASSLHEAYLRLLESQAGQAVVAARTRLQGQLVTEREELAMFHQEVLKWPKRITRIRGTRLDALANVKAEVERLTQDSTSIKINRTAMRLLPLRKSGEALVASLCILRDASLTSKDNEFLSDAAALAQRVISTVRSDFDTNWECRRDADCKSGHEVISIAFDAAESVESQLTRLSADTDDMSTDLDQLLDPSLGLITYLPPSYKLDELLPGSLTRRARSKLPLIINAEGVAKEAAAKARAAADEVRAVDVAEALRAMDLDVLRKAAPQAKIRTSSLQAYDLHNVWDVLQFQDAYYLDSLPGLGEASARAITQATLRLFDAVREETPVRIDVKRKSEATAALLESLRGWSNARKFSPTEDEVAVAAGLSKLTKKKFSLVAGRVLAVVEGEDSEGRPSVSEVLTDALERTAPPPSTDDIWTDFLSRPADYFGMLTELGFMTEDEKSMHGDLPEEIVEAVRAKELKRDYLTASLRTYQSFGARFALVQEKVVIGDEMGLGKTVEALAVLAHLRARGQSHFLVVCPAAVVSNWIRETAKHTKLKTSRLHGSLWERTYAAKTWIRNGGVAITTYDLLPWAKAHLSEVDLGCAIFDEAHYIKNPRAKRSLAAAEIIDSIDYAILMTGTPLENSVSEFRNLIGYIRPDLSEDAPEYFATAFRKHVAPAYLRRNQEDVLTELPEIVEVDEWMGMSAADEQVYRQAVAEGQFMLMRRAAMLSEQSMKIDRLLQIVEEAEANGRRVIVFSYFREVLSEVARLLPGQVFGPLTGSVPAADRQELVDRFSQAGHGAVLVAQITAGGVGLNIQSASVVVICEPQIKPTMESQAIARAHRMGQTNTVQVHRLLTEDSVDQRIRDILEVKMQLFDEFARDSVIAKQAPDAVDVSEVEIARMVVAAERERLAMASR